MINQQLRLKAIEIASNHLKGYPFEQVFELAEKIIDRINFETANTKSPNLDKAIAAVKAGRPYSIASDSFTSSEILQIVSEINFEDPVMRDYYQRRLRHRVRGKEQILAI